MKIKEFYSTEDATNDYSAAKSHLLTIQLNMQELRKPVWRIVKNEAHKELDCKSSPALLDTLTDDPEFTRYKPLINDNITAAEIEINSNIRQGVISIDALLVLTNNTNEERNEIFRIARTLCKKQKLKVPTKAIIEEAKQLY